MHSSVRSAVPRSELEGSCDSSGSQLVENRPDVRSLIPAGGLCCREREQFSCTGRPMRLIDLWRRVPVVGKAVVVGVLVTGGGTVPWMLLTLTNR
jgi:hypothetical protein